MIMKKPKFNVIDCLIIMCVALCLAGGLYIFTNLKETSTSGANPVKIRYTVEFTRRDAAAVSLFEEAAEKGDHCFVSEKEKADATLVKTEYTPAKVLTTNSLTGETDWADIPELYDITVTLESEGTETDDTLTAGTGTAIKVGDEISVKGKGYAGYGFITSLEIAE